MKSNNINKDRKIYHGVPDQDDALGLPDGGLLLRVQSQDVLHGDGYELRLLLQDRAVQRCQFAVEVHREEVEVEVDPILHRLPVCDGCQRAD